MSSERDLLIRDEYNEAPGLKDSESVTDLKYKHKWNSRYHWKALKESEIFPYDLLVLELWQWCHNITTKHFPQRALPNISSMRISWILCKNRMLWSCELIKDWFKQSSRTFYKAGQLSLQYVIMKYDSLKGGYDIQHFLNVFGQRFSLLQGIWRGILEFPKHTLGTLKCAIDTTYQW